ncbi:MmgE/PrpD family protein, partial [Chloroflexota bacterium]
ISGSGLLAVFKAPRPLAQAQVARACEAGIVSAWLAHSGLKGYGNILEEGFLPAFCDEYHLDLVGRDLAKVYMIPETYIKLHGGCRHIHAPIDATLHIANEHRIAIDDIEQVRVKTYSITLDLDIDNPQTSDEARFNIPFAISLALVFGTASVDRFTDDNLKNERIQKLMGRIIVEHDAELDKEYPAKRGTIVEVSTRDGQTFSHRLDFAKGEPESPLSQSEIVNKFKYLTSGVISTQASATIIHLVNRLEALDDACELLAQLGA